MQLRFCRKSTIEFTIHPHLIGIAIGRFIEISIVIKYFYSFLIFFPGGLVPSLPEKKIGIPSKIDNSVKIAWRLRYRILHIAVRQHIVSYKCQSLGNSNTINIGYHIREGINQKHSLTSH